MLTREPLAVELKQHDSNTCSQLHGLLITS